MNRAILLVDHGSRRPEANAQLEQLAAMIAQRVPGAIVRFAHMELAAPDIATAVAQCAAAGARELVVQPYFLAPGNHSTHDIPQQVHEAATRHPDLSVRVSEPLGLHPKLVDVILDRVEEAAHES